MLIDYHLHSKHSPDGSLPIEEICQRAIEQGLAEIAITDHADLEWPFPEESFHIVDVDQYFNDIAKAQQKFAGQLTIRKGIEFGLQEESIPHIQQWLKTYDFDFVIGSVHLVKGVDPYGGSFYRGKTKEESYIGYYKEVSEMIDLFKDFDVLGHLDYVKRYMPFGVEKDEHLMANELVQEVLEKLVRNNIGLEINTSGYRHGTNASMPHQDILKQYYQLGGRMLTMGSDGHDLAGVGYEMARGQQELREVGFTEITTFANRKPIFQAMENLAVIEK